jgi:putative DNA primase/helicase
LRIKNKYYLPDKTVAFEDHGNKLKVETENHTVIRDALAIAETRGWQCITVSGTQSFKQQVWREAFLKGMNVSGYQPTEFEMAELNQARTVRDAHGEAMEPH